jgi:hypothetical protein
VLRPDDPVEALVNPFLSGTAVSSQRHRVRRFGLRDEPDALAIVQRDAFIPFVLLLRDPDLLLEKLDGFPESLVNAVCQARRPRK